jgi:putative ABC transport system substrate-binding protein
MIQRREFIALLGGSAAAWPLVARAQPLPVIEFMYAGSPNSGTLQISAFRKGLSEAGFVEGRNLAIEFRYAQNDPDLLPDSLGPPATSRNVRDRSALRCKADSFCAL